MSRETSKWLNTMTLIGFADKRGTAWHYRQSSQGDEANHYPGPIPIEDVKRRLFGWEPVEGTVETTVVNENGVLQMVDKSRKAIIRPPGSLDADDLGAILGIFKQGYTIHRYEPWLLGTVATILDDNLSIGSAGLLSAGAVAWVSVEVPDSIITPEGVEFRPNLLASTSLDGTMATTFSRVVTNVVCDNTLAAAHGEQGQRLKIRHSKNSIGKLTDAREALAVVHSIGDEFSKEVAQLCNTPVSEDQFKAFLDSLVPVPEEKGRGLTLAEKKRGALVNLYNFDLRVSPWKDTAYGVLQMVNTYTHHSGIIKGDRVERNMLRAISGGVDKLDNETLAKLDTILTPA